MVVISFKIKKKKKKKKQQQQQQQQQQREVNSVPCLNIFWYWGKPHSSLSLVAQPYL